MYQTDLYSNVPRKNAARRAEEWGAMIRRAGKEFVSRLPMAAAFFLLGIAQCFSVPSPYALCCLMALTAAGEKPRGPVLGLAAGLGFRMLWGIDWDIWQFAVCLLCLPLRQIKWRKNWQWVLMTGAMLLVRALPGMAAAEDVQTILLSAVSVPLGMASMPALCRAGRIIKARQREFSKDDLLCLAFPGLLLIAGAGRLSAFHMNIGYGAAVLLVVLLAWVSGAAAGVCGGMGCGLALLLGGQSALLLVNLTLGALLAGLFQGKSRALSAGTFLLAHTVSTYLITFSFQRELFFSALAGCLVFCLTPGKWMKRAVRFVRRITWIPPKENAYTRLKMQRWVRAIDCMADALPHPRIDMPAAEEESQALTDGLCPGCDRLPICWHDQYDQTKEAMEALVGQNGTEDEAYSLINQHFSSCPRISRLPALLSQLASDRQKRTQQGLCAEYERDMLQTHLTALSQAAQRISLEGENVGDEELDGMSRVEEALQSLAFPGSAAFVKRVDGRLIICLQSDPLAFRPATGQQLTREIGVRFGKHLRVTEQQGGHIVMEEEPPLKAVTGMATACAVNREKKRKTDRRPDNGDAVLVRSLQGGHMLLALSDGMGHGAGAQEESRKTLELLSLCMEAGYTREQAMTAVNGSMLSATGGEKFATVDLCLIDLWSGETAMNKLGACASYLIQGQRIHVLEGAALPLGIIEHVVPMEHHAALGEGDILLMMSDGVADSFADDEEIMALLRRSRRDSPQQIADTLLREALLQQNGLPPDDMTVLCARLESQA